MVWAVVVNIVSNRLTVRKIPVSYTHLYALVRTSSRISEKASHKSEISLDELADAVDMTQSSSPCLLYTSRCV